MIAKYGYIYNVYIILFNKFAVFGVIFEILRYIILLLCITFNITYYIIIYK